MPFIEEVFRADSELAIALLQIDPALVPDGLTLLVRSFDALAAGLGFALDNSSGRSPHDRTAIANAARASHEPTLRALDQTASGAGTLAELYRERQAVLLEMLASDEKLARRKTAADPVSAGFAAHRKRLARLGPPLHRAGALRFPVIASLLHLAAVRLAGASPGSEAVAAYLWQRATESRIARARGPKPKPSRD